MAHNALRGDVRIMPSCITGLIQPAFRAILLTLVAALSASGIAGAAEPLPNCGDVDRHFDPNETPMAPIGAGAVYYVDAASGNDGNNGTSEQTAFKTIGRAVNNSAAPIGPGSTVRIKAGLYRERLIITKSGTASQRIVVGAYGNGPVVVDGSTAVTGWTQVSGQIYKATPGFKVRAVVVDEEPLFPEKSQGPSWRAGGTSTGPPSTSGAREAGTPRCATWAS